MLQVFIKVEKNSFRQYTLKRSSEKIRVNKALVQEAKNGGSAKKHKKFGSDDGQEEEEHVFSTARESQDVEDDESSDDDAPEEVGAQTAVQKVKAQAESAKQAIQRYVWA